MSGFSAFSRTLLAVLVAGIIFAVSCSGTAEQNTVAMSPKADRSGLAKYEPADGKILVFAGQDNEAVGGNDRFRDGYVDHIGVPAGITHYIGFNRDNETGPMAGLNVESDWQAGPMCLKYYLESAVLKDAIVHLSIAMPDSEGEVARGVYDTQIAEIGEFMETYRHRAFMLRIGYEFDGSWNHYDSTAFKFAYRRIVDRLRQKGLTNFALCLASSSPVVPYQLWQNYYPGDDYVDWLGYSYWEGSFSADTSAALIFAKDKNKPIFIAEITPRGHFLNQEDGEALWNTWYKTFFEHIEQNRDQIKAISYINANWDAQLMWKGNGWGDTRLQINPHIKKRWLDEIAEAQYVNGDDQPLLVIGFRHY